MFSELIQYQQNRVESIAELEDKLSESGHGIGIRIVELVSVREKLVKRETRIVNVLQFVSNTLWKYLFNKVADNLERSTENEDECKLYSLWY